MPKKACCCKPKTFCCNPTFYRDFITLYGETMAEHAEVSPDDWIALYVPRQGTPRGKYRRWLKPLIECNCCCGCPNTNFTGDNTNTNQSGNDSFTFLNVNTLKSFSLTNSVFGFLKNNFSGRRSDNATSQKPSSTTSNVDLSSSTSSSNANQSGSDGFIRKSQRTVRPIDIRNNPSDVPCFANVDEWRNGNHDLSSPPHVRCANSCCSGDWYTAYMPGAQPIIFAYKYSGCHLKWYPREWSFNYDTHISQCNGFIGNGIEKVNDVDITKEMGMSCQPFAYHGFELGSTPDTFCQDCNKQNIDPAIGNDNTLPCACLPFPHIHGGVYDSVYNRINVKLNPYQLGYVSSMKPFQHTEPMTVEEAGCCWCAGTGVPGQDFISYTKTRRSVYYNLYPKADQQGKIPSPYPSGPGVNCHYRPYDDSCPLIDCMGFNPYYKPNCYSWGISPYLLRISRTKYKMAYDIWGHGRYGGYAHDFGVVYQGSSVKILGTDEKDIEIKFKKIQRRSTLREQYIGFVQLEHHFECYSYRSDSASASIDMLAVQNSCKMLVPTFERGYAGTFTSTGSNKAYWSPHKYDSILFQIKRGVPRRTMYTGSGVPLFHFDLVNMENISQLKSIVGPDGSFFNGCTFLEHYYRYFFAMLYFPSGACTECGELPGPVEWNFAHLLPSYQYVTRWIELMIENGIIRIKDHAIDIAENVNEVISTGAYITNDQGKKEIIIPDTIAKVTGGLSGYIELIDFFGVCAGAQNAITPKIIKEKLLNEDGLAGFTGPSGDLESMRCFLPRKATLPLSSIRPGMTAWGCKEASPAGHTYDRLNCASYTPDAINIPPAYNETNPESIWINLNSTELVSGLARTFVIDSSRKISSFGGNTDDGDNDISDNDVQYPPSVPSVPWYLNVASLFDLTDPEHIKLQSPEKVPDGKVIQLAFKGSKFASCLCDFEHGAIGSYCTSNSPGGLSDDNVAYEQHNGDESDESYIVTDCNGENLAIGINGNIFCAPNQPFEVIPGASNTTIYGPRAVMEKRSPTAFRIKSWGSEATLATFSLAQQDQQIYGGGYDGSINIKNLRYPGTNTWFIWTKIAAGLEHFVALDDYGGVFASPLSDNTYKQCEKGFPITYEESEQYSYLGFGRSEFNNGQGFFYFNHIPRPGYIKEEEWTKDYYISLTSPDNNFATYRDALCSCEVGDIRGQSCRSGTVGGGGGGDGEDSCYNYQIFVGSTCGNVSTVYDKTCYLLGSLIPNSSVPIGEYRDSQPRYTNVVAGHYNTLLLTNENKIEIYGTYWQIDPNGKINGPMVPIDDGSGNITTELRGITAFVPDEVIQLKGDWSVEYACPIHCSGITHSPIINATYIPPGESNRVTDMDSAADYSICIANNNRIYVWGEASMVPGKYNPDTYIPGTTASTQFTIPGVDTNLVNIDSIAAGVNAFYIYYRLKISGTDLSSSRVYSYTRFGKENFGTEVPKDMQNKEIIDISAGYDHAVAIYSKGLEAKIWDYDSFAEGTEIYQYKNWESIPPYFKRDAFFHAIPGFWDYSKWLYGDVCCGNITDPDHPILQIDRCSALAYNIYESDENGNPAFNINLSYSGHPEYFWMRPSWRRLTKQGFDNSYSPIKPSGGQNSTDASACTAPDNGMQLDLQSNNTETAGLFFSCFNQRYDVWSGNRPQSDKPVIGIQQPIEPQCWHLNECYGGGEIYVKQMIPQDAPALATGHDVVPDINFKSTRDIFQRREDYYGDDAFSNSPDVASFCAKHQLLNLSYFKYSERHYYFGYDRNLDTWDIYENPDFLHENTRNGFTSGATCDHSIGEGITAALGRCPIILQNSQNGWGGGTGANGGTAAGLCGYYSLFNYPMTGPNYVEEIYQLLPPNYMSDINIRTAFDDFYCSYLLRDPNAPLCYACGPLGIPTQFNVPYVMLGYFGGPAVYKWLQPCNGMGSPPLAPMMAAHIYFEHASIFMAGKDLLKGTNNHIGLTLPPNIDPDYTNYSFLDVLKNEDLTETIDPWKYPDSTKWIPLCWESKNVLNIGCPGISGETDSAICFAGYVVPDGEQNLDDYELEYICTVKEDGTPDVTFYTINATCNVKSCCPCDQ